MANSLLSQIVARLDHAGVPSPQFPDGRGEYWAHCPFHEDEQAHNFSVSEKGHRCSACDAKGGLGVPKPGTHGVPSKPGTHDRLHGCAENGGGGFFDGLHPRTACAAAYLQGRIVATSEDYAAVYDLVLDVLSEGLQASVPPGIREVVRQDFGVIAEAVRRRALARRHL